jgi:hypothetical protein
MNWTLIGWIVIALAAILLAVFSWGVRMKTPPPRKTDFIQRYLSSRSTVMEQGKPQQVILGNRLWSRTYPGLGLSGLSALPSLISPETLSNGRQSISSASGSLAVIARQVVEGRYTGEFSEQLTTPGVETIVPGLTPFSFTAGLLPEINRTASGNLLYLGDYGPESVLAVQKAAGYGAQVFAGAGSITAQATLFLCVHDLLLGEEVFMLAPSLRSAPQDRVGLWVEDLIRIGVVALLVIGAILKMWGVL